jgi:hypothetical protein
VVAPRLPNGPTFLDLLLDSVFRIRVSSVSLSFLYHCIKLNVFHTDRIIDKILSLPTISPLIGRWFGSELISICPECLCELGDVDWSLVGRYRNSDFDDQMLVSIRTDDVDMFQQFLGSVHFNVNYRPRLNELELEFTFLLKFGFGEIRMVELAAFYSATKCFKFCLMNGAEMENARAAILGGNPEIIRMTEERIGIDSKFAEIAIQQHRSDIALWIATTSEVVVAWIALAAATSNSLVFMRWSIENGFDVNSAIGFSQVHLAFPLEFCWQLQNTEVMTLSFFCWDLELM